MKKWKISLKAAEPKKFVGKRWRDGGRYRFGSPRSDITEDAFQPKETIVVVREAPQEISETQEKSVKPTQSYLSMKHKLK